MLNKLLSAFLLLSLSLTVLAQPVFVSSFDSPERTLPSAIQYDGQDLLLQSVGREVFSKLTPAEIAGFKTLCNAPAGARQIAQRVVAKLDEVNFDYSTACVGVQDLQRQVDTSDDYWGKEARNVQCPVNEDQLLTQCKKRLENEKKFIGWQEDDRIYCEAKFERYGTELSRYCKDSDFEDICPKKVYDSQIEEQVKQSCLAKGCTPYADRCGFTSCECRGNIDPIIIDDPRQCPVLSGDWRRMCEQSGGKPREEYRGTCTIPQCDFAGKIDDPRYCSQIAIPPGWEAQCRKRGGIPIPDDARGCPKAECRMPGRDFCPPLPSAPAGVLEKLCTDQTKEAFYGVDPSGCKYFTCVEKDKRQIDATPCPEVPQSWYSECKGSGGKPEVKSDPYRPVCMQFYCAGKEKATCSSSTENEQSARECVSNGGSVYYDYGQGNCPITRCHYSDDPYTCSKDSFTVEMEKSCKESGGTVALQYSSSCSYRVCQPGTGSKPGSCPVAHTCPDGSLAVQAYHDTRCPIYQCKEKLRPICPAIPACPTNEHAEATSSNPAAYSIAPCPTYTCKPNTPVTPISTNEYCPPSAPTTCTADQFYSSEPYSYTTPSGKSLTCYKSSCVSPSTLLTCTNSCSTYSYGPAAYSSSTQCTVNQRLRTSYMTYTESGKMCKCEGSKWCETDYSTLSACAEGSGCQAPTCTAGQTLKSSSSPYATTVNGVQCACTSKWCETDTSALPVCASAPGSGCDQPTSCSAGMTLQTSSSPYAATVNGVQCACTSKWCSSTTTPGPGTPGGGGTCPYISPVAPCTGTQVSTSELIPGYQNCYQMRCVDATTLPACTTTSCGSSTPPSCSSGQVLQTNYYSMQQDGGSCRCQSQWCGTDPATCASATCPSTNGPTSCPSGQILRTSTTPYTPPGCSGGSGASSLQCTSTWCETDSSQCASQTCPTSTTTCGTGYTPQSSGTYTYYAPGCGAPTTAGIQCPSSTCVASSSNVSASRVTGLDVYPYPSTSPYPTSVPAVKDICTAAGEPDRIAFVQRCLESRRGHDYRTYSSEGIDRICEREATYNKAELERFCTGSEKPYVVYRQHLDDSRTGLAAVYSQCRQFATREKLIELIEKKADVECKKMSLASEGLNDIDFLLTDTDLPPLDVSKVEVAANTIVLTQAQLEELKQEIRRDVLAQVTQDLSQMLGLRSQEETQEAQFKLEQVAKMQEAANSMKEVCLKLDGDDKEKCDAAVLEIEQRIQDLRREAEQQQATAGGIASLVQALANFLGGGNQSAAP